MMTEEEFTRQMIALLEMRAAGGGCAAQLDAAGVHRKLCFDFPQPTPLHLTTLASALRVEVGAISSGGGARLWSDLGVTADFASGVEYSATAASAGASVRAAAAEVAALVLVKLPQAVRRAADSPAADRFARGASEPPEDEAWVLTLEELIACARYELFAAMPSARWTDLRFSRDLVRLAHATESEALLRIASERAVDQRDDAVGVLTALLEPTVDAASPLALATLRSVATIATALDDGARGRGAALPRAAHTQLIAAVPRLAALLLPLAARRGNARSWGPLLDIFAAVTMRAPRGLARRSVAKLEEAGVLRTLTSCLFVSSPSSDAAAAAAAELADPAGHAAAISALLLFCALQSAEARAFVGAVPWVRAAVLAPGLPCCCWAAGEEGAQQRAPASHGALWALLLATDDDAAAAAVEGESSSSSSSSSLLETTLARRIADALRLQPVVLDETADATAAELRREIAVVRSTLALILRVEAGPNAWSPPRRGVLAGALSTLGLSVGAGLDALAVSASATAAASAAGGAAGSADGDADGDGADGGADSADGGGRVASDVRRKLLELRRLLKEVQPQSKAD